MVFQSYALFPHLSVADNVGYALRVRRRPRAEVRARVEALLALVRLDGLGARRPDALSGGQQQRVALARALSVRPRVLLLDEPLSNLDAHLRVLMREEIKRLQRDLHLTVVYVTHDQEEAMSISDRIAVMRAGRLEQVGPPDAIYDRPATAFVAGFVGTASFVPGDVVAVRPGAHEVRTALGVLTVSQAGGPPLAAGTRVTLVVRPEAIRLDPRPAGETAGVGGTITGVVYTGAVVRYAVDAGGTRFTVDVHDPRRTTRFAPGDPVTVHFPEDAHVLPAGNDP
jgi:ABC-type Fe3+/spermidine/putrescine transport system ATPase subunit